MNLGEVSGYPFPPPDGTASLAIFFAIRKSGQNNT